jgi:hypothetical protein
MHETRSVAHSRLFHQREIHAHDGNVLKLNYSANGSSACLLQAQPTFCALQLVLSVSLLATKKLYPLL